MSSDDNLIDFSSERSKRIHDLHEKRLNDVRQAFAQALPLPPGKKRRSPPASRRRSADPARPQAFDPHSQAVAPAMCRPAI
ncbi:hypothetical protein ACFS3C_15485 [Azotobacter vinelandii]